MIYKKLHGLMMIIIIINSSYLGAGSLKVNETEIGMFGDISDFNIKESMETFKANFYSEAKTLNYNELKEFDGILVLFGHGSPNGILFNGLNIGWSDFSNQISSFNSKLIILASCYGSSINQYNVSGPEIISWQGFLDAILLGLAAALVTMIFKSQFEEINGIIQKMIQRAFNLVLNIVTPLFLANSESGYASAYKRQNTGSWATTARIFWVNMDQSTGNEWTISQTAIIHLVAVLAEVAVLSGPVATVIAAVLLANQVLMYLSSYNRIRRDYKLGVRGFKYLPDNDFVYSLGDDDFRLDGTIYIPVATVPYVLYSGIGHVSTSWTSFNM